MDILLESEQLLETPPVRVLSDRMEPGTLIDISPVLSERTAVFPGDTAFNRRVALDFAQGDHLALSSIQTTLHAGAHADAPSHYHPEGLPISERDLRPYIGPCQVIEVRLPLGARIQLEDIRSEITAPRVLFKTGSFPDPELWNGDFNSLSPGLIEHLADLGVSLVGIDTPSIDPAEDRDLPSHAAVYRNNLSVLEGLVLEHVKPGRYTLVAPPLKIEGADASPVRAVLISEN